MKKLLLTASLAILCSFYIAAQTRQTSLNRNWLFALDSMKVGEKVGWTNASFSSKILDNVFVPHCYSVDKR